MIQEGYMPIMWGESFSKKVVSIHPKDVAGIVGKQGCILRVIEQELRVQLLIRKTQVTIVGSKDSVEKASEVVDRLLMYHHHDITHPGMIHMHYDLTPHQRTYLVGRKGSELRHIQNNFKVRVHMPHRHSRNPMTVVVGEIDNVMRAMDHIEMFLWWSAEQEKQDLEETRDHAIDRFMVRMPTPCCRGPKNRKACS